MKKMNRLMLSLTCTGLLIGAPLTQAGWLDGLSDLLGGSKNTQETIEQVASVVSNEDLTEAFKQALELGSQHVVQQVSATDGFNGDSAIHIPLPKELKKAKDLLAQVGMEKNLNDFEVRLNRAAEAAAPQAKQLFLNAIKEMSFDDVRKIYEGSEDAATRYFQGKMTPSLTEAMSPVINQSLSQVGAIKEYDKMIDAYKTIPFVPDIKADLRNHVLDGTLDGIFHYLGQQEAAIRKDPVKQTTELLKKVFGQS